MDTTLKLLLIVTAVLGACTIISTIAMVISVKIFGKKCNEFHNQVTDYALSKLNEIEGNE